MDSYQIIRATSSFSVLHDPIFITNDYFAIEIRLKEECHYDSLEFEVCGHRFSSVACQLFAVIEDEPSLDCLVDYARLIEQRYSEMDVKVFKIISIDKDGISLEDSVDYLHDTSIDIETRLHSLGQFDLA